ncbi:MAG TPA: thiamine pyrophosphate-dependent enzyme [Thermoanaerobaculia bacterium]|jgi:pyruvate/2-oxoglutarate/acetoin dehydrogenase E1 component/TPP-dependent pyruvate/acetoin dehydrogenase alpha subunit|nr:thiamine pyrophosphate-dependent enzyme [Thermoanaerobaculia bacterium]
MTFSLMDRDASSLPAGSAGSQLTRESMVRDYRLAFQSRQASLLGRREVFTGKGKFGIFGDGKEVAQVALARAFRLGDFRSGYYRDQTLMMALGLLTLEQFFAQLYADPEIEREPCSAGRSMNAHFSTCMLNADGSFKELVDLVNVAADVSPTASQMPRLAGLAYASKLYRELPELTPLAERFSRHGEEVAFGTIGNASCAEGMFWETVNAVGVLQAPMLLSIWDDGYGISVPNEFQVTKGDLSAILSGFQREAGSRQGYDLYAVKGWDYAGLCETYLSAVQIVRREHVPAIVHVIEMTQPQGHSTSGSHERYKSKERLEWEAEFDPIRKMRQWLIDEGIATAQELEALEEEDLRLVREARRRAWDEFREPIETEKREALGLLDELAGEMKGSGGDEVRKVRRDLEKQPSALRRDLLAVVHGALLATAADGGETPPAARRLAEWKRRLVRENEERYGSHLYSEGPRSALAIPPVAAVYREDSPVLNGFEVVNACFDAALARCPNVIALGEDVGQIGDVNQGFAGLQAKYGPLRVTDTGIREITIMGQAIGMALRGLRPIAEIQYLDYILYALQILSDDVANLHWRTKGRQKAPIIVRTRGHRLEGIWHAGSPMAGVLNLVRGMYLCVPRNMTQAAGFYNTLLESDDPAIVVEVLNSYRQKEKLPANIGELRLPLGVPEVLRPGRDVTVVTYGACCRIAMEAAEKLAEVGIEAEVIDVQTLLPFDLHGRIGESLRRTNRVLFLDEDVPGGATAFMLQQVVESQGGFAWLDSPPRTLTAKAHRPPYGSDGDYFSKPNRESIFEAVYDLMNEADPASFPIFYR